MEKKNCSGMVWSADVWSRQYSCKLSGTIERNGRWYCKKHDPNGVEERRQKIDGIWKEKWELERELRNLKGSIAEEARKLLPDMHKKADDLAKKITDLEEQEKLVNRGKA